MSRIQRDKTRTSKGGRAIPTSNTLLPETVANVFLGHLQFRGTTPGTPKDSGLLSSKMKDKKMNTAPNPAPQNHQARVAAEPNPGIAFSGLKSWQHGQSPEAAAALAFSRTGSADIGPELLLWKLGSEIADEQRIAKWLESVTLAWAGKAKIRFRQPEKMAHVIAVATAHARFNFLHPHAVAEQGLGMTAEEVRTRLGIKKSTYCALRRAASTALRTGATLAWRRYCSAFGVYELEDEMSENSSEATAAYTEATEQEWGEFVGRSISEFSFAVTQTMVSTLEHLTRFLLKEFREKGYAPDLVFDVRGPCSPLTIAITQAGAFFAERQTAQIASDAPSLEEIVAAGWYPYCPGFPEIEVDQLNAAYVELTANFVAGPSMTHRFRIPGRWHVGDFDPLFAYAAGDIVRHAENDWLCLRENEDAPGASDAWEEYTDDAD